MGRRLSALFIISLALAACSDEPASEAPVSKKAPPAEAQVPTPPPPPDSVSLVERGEALEVAERSTAVAPEPVDLPVPDLPAAQTALAIPTEPPAATQGEAIVRRAERVYEGTRTLKAEFVQNVTVPLINSTLTSRGTLYLQRPGRILMDFSDPADDLVVSDGRSLWMYYPSSDPKQAMKVSLGSEEQAFDLFRVFLNDAPEKYQIVWAGSDQAGGRPADILIFTPRDPESPYKRVRLWVDQKDSWVRRFEVEEKNESMRKLELFNLEPGIEMAESLFRFEAPEGVQVFSQGQS